MTHASLETTTHRSEGTVRIELRGDIDGSAGGALGAAYDETAGADSVLRVARRLTQECAPRLARARAVRTHGPRLSQYNFGRPTPSPVSCAICI